MTRSSVFVATGAYQVKAAILALEILNGDRHPAPITTQGTSKQSFAIKNGSSLAIGDAGSSDNEWIPYI
jgi:hypothetical protein